MTTNFFNKISAFFINYFSLSGQLVSQEEAERNIREGVSFKGTNILILILAIFVASLGLNTNSTAVIIGAMLISPLMGPIIGIGLGVGIHDFDLLKRCLRNLIMAAGFSVIAASIYFLISPVNEPASLLSARQTKAMSYPALPSPPHSCRRCVLPDTVWPHCSSIIFSEPSTSSSSIRYT